MLAGFDVRVIEHDSPFVSDLAARIGIDEQKIRDGLKDGSAFVCEFSGIAYMSRKTWDGFKLLHETESGTIQ
jgi:hypothetical protein